MIIRSNEIESSLNEIDVEVGNILLGIMQKADQRRVDNKPVWNSSRVIFASSQDKDTIFQSYMVKNNVPDITYPILAYTPSPEIKLVDHGLGANYDTYANLYIPESDMGNINEVQRSKIKRMISNYSVSVWDCDFKAVRYYQDKLILRCIDKCLFYEYKSSIMKDTSSYLSTLINIPRINTVTNKSETTKGSGYIYALGFIFDVWGILADDPETSKIIKQINLTINNKLTTDDRAIRITITE